MGRNHVGFLPYVLALPIFPVRLQTSIVGAGELNFRVRDGNGWTLTAINTNSGARTLKTEQSSPPYASQATCISYSRPV